MNVYLLRTLALTLAGVALAGCGGDSAEKSGGSAASSRGAGITGAGSTFAYPLYSRWSADFAKKTGTRVNYQSIGSGGGIRQFSELTVDFGASDGPMTDEEMARAKGKGVLHIPIALGAVVITYNVPQVKEPLTLDGAVITDLFLGKITKWNDPRIAGLNPGVSLPAQDVLVVHRSDGSGTTFVITDYLAAVSPDWARSPGRGKEVQWPVGLGAKGNEGVAGQVKQTPGSIGYVELAYAKQNNLQVARLRNAAGQVVEPTVASITAAAAGAADSLPASTDYRMSIINAPGAESYPISTFTWALVYNSQQNAEKGKSLVEFLRYGLSDEGQRAAAALDYAPLPKSMRDRLLQRIDSIQIGAAASGPARD